MDRDRARGRGAATRGNDGGASRSVKELDSEHQGASAVDGIVDPTDRSKRGRTEAPAVEEQLLFPTIGSQPPDWRHTAAPKGGSSSPRRRPFQVSDGGQEQTPE